MYRDDYILRMIRQLIDTLVKVLFHAESPSLDYIQDLKALEAAEHLLRTADSGHISEAENALYMLTENRTMDNLFVGVSFYSHLNEMEDAFLEANDFSREEIKDGIRHLLSEYGLEAMADLFFYDIP